MSFFHRMLIVGLCFMPVGAAHISYAQTQQHSEIRTSFEQSPSQVQNKVNFSPLFVLLSDAMSATKNQDKQSAQEILTQLENQLIQLQLAPSETFQVSQQALQQAKNSPNPENLSALSNALYSLEKSSNPVDYSAERQAFNRAITPAFDRLKSALSNTQAQEALRAAYHEFNLAWTKNERVVRNTSAGHYGNIETSMALLRVAIESHPVNETQIQTQLANLQAQLDDYKAGNNQAVQETSLTAGIALLNDAVTAIENQNTDIAKQKLQSFITAWASFEGEVRTRDGALYTQIESQIPLILANIEQAKSQAELETLIHALKQINPSSHYGMMDALLILLREGLEALLIVTALLTMLNATKHGIAKRWVYLGAACGLLLSIVTAVALQYLFPVATSGSSRELIEGAVGIVAVVMMLGVGIWLHSKSSVKAWNHYLNARMATALSTGSFIGLFVLSFLAVFREGAETILFYAGILPNISHQDFILGIAGALLILAIVAILLFKTSVRLPIPTLFKLLTWLIYALGLKILGVSIYALQLNGYLAMNVISELPTVAWLGIYPTLSAIGAQILYLLAVIAITLYNHRHYH